jgi:sulfite reductase (ferredoxin)
MEPNYYGLPADTAADCDVYEHDVTQFLAGDLPADVLKAKRVARGVYEQRQDGTFMSRVRVAGGTLNAEQARELAALSREFGNGLLHVTTRQDIQFHDVAIGNTPAIMRRLLSVGLPVKGGGGNTVRNVTACPYAGVCRAEAWDVTPCAYAVTEYLITVPGSYNLPRKYKIAFSGCGADCALAQVSDLGFIAQVRDGTPGFRVLAGGGMGARSRIADVLCDWVPATEIIRVAETVRRLFDRLGDRTNRNRARLRYVFDRIGVAAFRQQYDEEMAVVIREGVPEWRGRLVPADGTQQNIIGVPPAEIRHGIRVIPQRQAGVVAIPLHLPLGFLPANDFARVGELAARYSSESGLRTTRTQHLLLRGVKDADVPHVAADLRALETDVLTPTPLDRFVACAGASTCRLGLCLARNAARACAVALEARGVARDTLDAMQFHINGCPNACGQQPVGAIGCYGASQRVAGRLVPSYVVTIGGRCGVDGVQFGTAVGKVPAAALPAAMGDLAVAFASQRAPGESFLAYADRMGIELFKTVLRRHAVIPDFSERPDIYRDVGETDCFSLDGCGSGECGAGALENHQPPPSRTQTATGDASTDESGSCCIPGCVCTPPR